MPYSQLRGIECLDCSEKFRWIDLPKANRLNFRKSICICPKCDTELKGQWPKSKLLPLSFFAAISLPLFFISIAYWHGAITVVIGVVMIVGLIYFLRNMYEHEYILTERNGA